MSPWLRPAVAPVLVAVTVLAAAQQASAGDVLVQRIDRQVFVLGEDASDQILLSSPAEGVLRIESPDPATTTIDGTDFVEMDMDRRDALFFMMGAGINSVKVTSLPVLKRMTVLVAGDAADDWTFDGAVLTGDLVFAGGPGADRLTFTNFAGVDGHVLAVTGGGGDQFTAADATFGGQLVLSTGDGNPNLISFERTTVARPAVIVGGAGTDRVTFADTIFERALRLDLAAGADEVYVEAGNEFRGKTTMFGGAGPDTFAISGDPLFVLRVLIDGGEGDDIVDVGLAHFQAPLRLAGGEDDDEFRLHEFQTTSRVVLEAGDGDDVVDVDDTTVSVGLGGTLAGETGIDTLVGGRNAGMVSSGFERTAVP
jgi:hypothetical protein